MCYTYIYVFYSKNIEKKKEERIFKDPRIVALFVLHEEALVKVSFVYLEGIKTGKRKAVRVFMEWYKGSWRLKRLDRDGYVLTFENLEGVLIKRPFP